MDTIKKLEHEIATLKIQGATNVAIVTFDGVLYALSHLPKKAHDNPGEYLLTIGKKLAYARPTEPLAQNALRFIFEKTNQPVDYYAKRIVDYRQMIVAAKKSIAKYGADLITTNGIYLTHCHSSTAIAAFIAAKKQGKRFRVFVAETRPLFQGRITASELLKVGVDTTFVIDDVTPSLIAGRCGTIDAVFIGADLLSQTGFVNKVGSFSIALACKQNRTPLYCLTTLLKYDPRPFADAMIEKRSSTEIWPDAPKNLQFYAPAFDFVPYNLTTYSVCETGMIPGKYTRREAIKQYPFLSKI